MLALVFLSLMLGAAPAAAAPGPTPVPTAGAGALKYYIVGPAVDGRPEYLFDIALRTLGTGRRYLEIFSLNQGRTQPDGGQLQDPAVLHPGWLLILPPDATGPSVHTGPLPTRAAPAVPQPVATGAPGRTAATGSTSATFDQVSAVVLVMTVTVGALWLLRRGRRLSLPARAAPVGAEVRGGIPAEPVPAPHRSSRPPVKPVPVPPAIRPPTTPAPGRTTAGLSTVVGSLGMSSRPATPVPLAGGPPPVPAAVADPLETVLETEVLLGAGSDSATVRLAGIRARPAEPGWLWLDPTDPRPPAPTVVVLGAADGAPLGVDLSQAPDVLTIVGHLAGGRRLAANLARQLSTAGVAVTVVGAAVGTAVTGARTVDTLAEAEDFDPPTEPYVVFCGPAQESQLAAVRQLTLRSQPHTVVVLVGPERRSRWSIQVHPPRVDD